MKTIISITMTCDAMPEQYEGRLDTGEYFYIRFRYGEGCIRVGNEEQWKLWTLPEVAAVEFPDKLLGVFPKDPEWWLLDLLEIAEISPGTIDLNSIPISPAWTEKDMQEKVREIKSRPSYKEGDLIIVTKDEDMMRGLIPPPTEEGAALKEALHHMAICGSQQAAQSLELLNSGAADQNVTNLRNWAREIIKGVDGDTEIIGL